MYMDLTDMISGGTEEQQVPEQKLTKEEYAAKKQQEREEVWAEVDSQAQGVFQDGEKLKGFLDFMAECNTQRTPNLLLIYGQHPDFKVVRSYERWREEHRSVKVGEHGITYMISTEYEKDGEMRRGYTIGKGFDISQMSGKPLEERPQRSLTELIGTVLKDQSVRVQIEDDLPDKVQAQYNPRYRTIYIRNGMSEVTTFHALNRELACAALDQHTGTYSRQKVSAQAYCAAYVIAKRYGVDVIEIPTNKPVLRKDLEDAVYKTKEEKYRAVVEAVKEAHATGQPVLVGTITIEVSELLSRMLKKEGIQHNVLNAKYHEKEAEIVADAGVHGAVTIATNMAGRGTDIKLDDDAKAAGGLKIIGTERHESRRIDNQLRGRSGRQGDPGESRFYISLEDDLMRLFGSEKLMGVFNTLGVEDGEQIEHKMLSNAIEKAQKKIEANNFGIRKNLLEYDQVMNEQREIIYAERRRVLDGESMRDTIYSMITEYVENMTDRFASTEVDPEEWDIKGFEINLHGVIPQMELPSEEECRQMRQKELKHLLKERAVKAYESKEAEFPEAEQLREVERVILLKVIDARWMDHIDDMDQLRQGIGLQAYGQRDPLVEYKMMGYDMFGEMTNAIAETTIRTLFHLRVEEKVEREEVAKVTGTNKDDTSVREPKKREEKKIYPNDPCPCGSGKKYKQCCGRKIK